MYKIRIVLMALLSVGVTAGAAVLALRKNGNENPDRERIEFLVRSLGDQNPDIRRKAEAELRQFGPKAIEALRQGAKSSDAQIAERSSKLLREFEAASTDSASKEKKEDSKPEPDRKTVDPDPRGVSLQISHSGQARFYVRITNHDAASYFVARDRGPARIYYGRFARFEVVDASGKKKLIQAEMPPTQGAKADFIVLGPGETLDFYAGQDDGKSFDLGLAPGKYQVRFLYDATLESPYREVAKAFAGAAPLPPQLFASAPIELTIVD